MIEKRKYAPEVVQAIGLVDLWFADRGREIFEIMDEYRAHWTGLDCTLDLKCRTLSEMAICWSVQTVAELLPLSGFGYISPSKGWVRASGALVKDDRGWASGHGFLLQRESGVLACLTFGQFILPFRSVGPGKRVDVVRRFVPHLVVQGEFGVALLRGRTDEIHSLLGLDYYIREQNPS